MTSRARRGNRMRLRPRSRGAERLEGTCLHSRGGCTADPAAAFFIPETGAEKMNATKIVSRFLSGSVFLLLAASATTAQPEKKPPYPMLPVPQTMFRLNILQTTGPDLYRAATAAGEAYSPEAPTGWIRVSLPRNQTIFGASDTVLIVRKDDTLRRIEIAIRGTANLDDLLRDLNSVATLDDVIDVPLHTGFRVLAKGVFAYINQAFTPDEVKNYEFRLYGHSLGGAIASIVAMYLHQTGSRVGMVVTFGGPRFTTNEGARKYQVLNQATYRVVRCDDAIAFLPPPNFFGWSTDSYQGNGNVLLLLKPPSFDYSQGLDIERDFMHQLRLELENRRADGRLVFGHRMENYTRLLGWFTGASTPPVNPTTLQPVSYQLSRQAALCPQGLGNPSQ